MPDIPGSLIPYIGRQIFDADGHPVSGAKIYSYEAGTSTPLPLYLTAEIDSGNEAANPVECDINGRYVAFMGPNGYKFIVTDSDDVELYTVDGVVDNGQTQFNDLGVTLQEGSRDVVSGYTIIESDNLITVNSTPDPDPCVINLPAVSTRRFPVAIKNLGTNEIVLTPNGADTIDENGALFIPAASGTTYPTLVLMPDGVSNWWIWAGYRMDL